MTRRVGIFWDILNYSGSMGLNNGHDVANKIRNAVHPYGSVTSFKAYHGLRIIPQRMQSELQSSGVSITFCPSPEDEESDCITETLLTDMLTFAFDNETPSTIVLISENENFAYPVSLLRLRQYDVVIVEASIPINTLRSQASSFFDWDTDIMKSQPSANDLRPQPPRSLWDKILGSSVYEHPKMHHEPEFDSYVEPTHRNDPSIQGFVYSPEDGHSRNSGISANHGGQSASSSTTHLPAQPPSTPKNAEDFVWSPPRQTSTHRDDRRTSSSVANDILKKPSEKGLETPQSSHYDEKKDPKPSKVSSMNGMKETKSYSVSSAQTVFIPPALRDKGVRDSAKPPTASHRDEEPDKSTVDRVSTNLPPNLPAKPVQSFPNRTMNVPSNRSYPLNARAPSFQPPPKITFHLLIEKLEKLQQKSSSAPLRSLVGNELFLSNRSVYRDAGVAGFNQYIALAEKMGIVQMGGTGGKAWVALRPDWRENVKYMGVTSPTYFYR